MHLWDKAAEPIEWEELAGAPCWAGLDLASTRDIAALVLCFPRDNDEYLWLPRFFVPEDVQARHEHDRREFAGWIDQGLITATAGNETDYATIQEQFRQDCETYDVRGLAFDPWNASKLIQDITEAGYPLDLCQKFPQTVTHFAEPVAKLLSLVKTRKLKHAGHPVLRWMASNMATKVDPSGNMRPDKAKSADKIDGMVAGIMALDGAMRKPAPQEASLWFV
jgi:phage terminase large subunit-like protein